MNVVDQVRELRRRAGVSVAALAARTGLQASNISAIEHGARTPQSATLEKAAAGLGARLIAVTLDNVPLVADTAAFIRKYVEVGDEEGAYRAFLQLGNDLEEATAVNQVLISVTRPTSISPKWDAAIAGLVEWRLAQKSSPVPEWVTEIAGEQQWRWAPGVGPRLFEPRSEEVPEPLRERGIWIEEGELQAA